MSSIHFKLTKKEGSPLQYIQGALAPNLYGNVSRAVYVAVNRQTQAVTYLAVSRFMAKSTDVINRITG